MKVINELKVYEVEGAEVAPGVALVVRILSHWNFRDRVVIEMPDGHRHTVLRRDLEKAVANACNHGDS